MRYLIVGGCVLAYFAVAVAVGKWLKRCSTPLPEPMVQQYTVLWRNPEVEVVTHACRGTITELDEYHILVSDDDNWPVIVDRRLITVVMP